MLQATTSKTDQIQRAILGSILLEDRCFYDVSDIISPMMFSGWLGAVANLVWDQVDSNGEISIASLAHDADQRFQVDQSSIYSLTSFAQPKGIIQNAQKLKEEYLRFHEIQIAKNTLEKLQKGMHTEKVVSDSQAERDLLHGFNDDHNKTRASKLSDWFDGIIQAKKGNRPLGIETPFKEINDAFGGLHPTNYTIVAARSAMGKTTFLLDLILYAILNKVPCLFFSFEMSYNEILSLLAQKVTGVSNRNMRSGKVDESQLKKIQEFIELFYELPIFIETGCNVLSDFKHKAQMYSRKYGIKFISLDYIQRMYVRGFRGNRTLELEQISRALKDLVSENNCNCHLMALSQLNRSVDSRPSKKPMLSDLRDSGSLEQDADNIILKYRLDYYGIMEDTEGISTKGIVYTEIAKNRHVSGGLKTVKLQYDEIHNQLSDHQEGMENAAPKQSELMPAASNIKPIKPEKVSVSDPIPF